MNDITPHKDIDPDRIPGEGPLVEIGQWYWLKVEADKDERVCAVVKVGSNFVELHDPYGHYKRVHLDKFEKECRRETSPEAFIMGRVGYYQGLVRAKLQEINKITARLGVSQNRGIEMRPDESASRALAVLSETDNVKEYKKELVQAQQTDLPALFKEVEEANKNLVVWLKAQTLPLKGMVDGMKDCIAVIEDRVFNVSLYAGLTEEVVQVAKGDPAPITEKLRILQRLAYMDEECLAGYQHGGIEFQEIGSFDKWLRQKENFERILPFPRCMVAFRVRRNSKEREWDGTLSGAFVNVQLGELDKLTFLYIRNGKQLYRLSCDLEFGGLIFPGKDEFNLNEPMMAKMFCDRVEEVITKRHYDDLVETTKREIAEGKVKAAQWKKDHPKEKDFFNPHRHQDDDWKLGRLKREYQPFNKDCVYYDEIKDEIDARVKQYNRIALIVQGLYDRSTVLHPHQPVRLWSPEGFHEVIELIYADHALYFGEAPDFEAYRMRCNVSIEKGSLVVGQEDFWQAREARIENRRRSYRRGESRPVARYSPCGNPGPGYIAEVKEWNAKKRRALFQWQRERQAPDYWKGQRYGDLIPAKLWTPAVCLFNIDAYKPGDYKQFYQDPRTRADYLKWAPLLIAAEEFHAGNLDMVKGELKEKIKAKKRKK